MTDPVTIEHLTFEAQELVESYPPAWRDRNKQIVASISCPPDAMHRGRIEYSRWSAVELPEHVDLRGAADRIADVEGFFDYTPYVPEATATEWHMNFADPHLFVAYGSSLFAQDEMQVTEHPALGSLVEALRAQGQPTITVEHGSPTPVLVRGVERRCRVATDPDPDAGRPHGLYGNAFSRADEDAIRQATSKIDPPNITNLIAMAALPPDYGTYTESQITHIMTTAVTGFRAAVIESHTNAGASTSVVVHTGFWGCGAFGGNRVLMTALQAIAAHVADVDHVVFHTGENGQAEIQEARALLTELEELASLGSYDLVQHLVDMDFEWGQSDGN